MAASNTKKDKPQPINVYLRVRPSNKQERDARSLPCVEILSSKEVVVKQQHGKKYSFERVFGSSAKQVDVYVNVVRPLIPEVLAGYNCTVFAYGQTGTGKTYTMAGGSANSLSVSWHSDEDAGIIPRALAHLFEELRLQQQQEFTVRVSYLELYNEDIYDLLSDGDDSSRIRIYEDQRQKGSVIVQGIEEITVCNKKEVYKILEKGQEKRRTAATLMNAQSSRSHTVFCITVYSREATVEGEEVVKMGKLNLVDLAGSENISRSGAVEIRAREAGNINQSLLTLGRCIKALVERSAHVPYRESKLTRILQDSLGGRTKTSIIATISPTMSNLEETLSTLDYAYRARNITNRPEVNQRLSKRALLCQYTEEIERLRKDLNAAHSKSGVYLAQDNYQRLLANSEYQKEEVAEKIIIIRDLENKIKLIEQEKAMKEKEWEDVTRSFQQVQEHLEKYAATEKVLKEQAETLLQVAERSTANESKLHEKVEHFYEVTSRNKEKTKRLIAFIDDNFKRISGEIEDFYIKCDSRNKSLLDIAVNSQQLVEGTVQSLNRILGNEESVEDIACSLQTESGTKFRQLHRDIKQSNENGIGSIQDFLTPFKDLFICNLNQLHFIQEQMLEQHREHEHFMVAVLTKMETMRNQIVQPMENLLAQIQKIKQDIVSTKQEIQEGLTLEQNLQEKLAQVRKDNMKKLKTCFGRMDPAFDTVETNLKKYHNDTDASINQMQSIVEGRCVAMDQFYFTVHNVDKVAHELTNFKISVDDILVELANKFKRDTINVERAHQDIRDLYSSKLDRLKDSVSNTRHELFSMEGFLEVIHADTQNTIQNLKEITEHIEQKTVANKNCMNSCMTEVKQIVNEELVTVTPTGDTPLRTQFKFPRKLATTSPKGKILEKFRQIKIGSNVEETSVHQGSILNTNNSNKIGKCLPPQDQKSSCVQGKENVPKGSVQ